MSPAPWRTRQATILAWCLFDWAGSAFSTIVVTFVFATYFIRAVAPDPVSGTAAWATAQATAGVTIAVLAAPLGVVADRGGHGRRLLGLCVGLLTACTAALWFVRPHAGDAPIALALVAVATVAFEIGFVFYNAMLTDIAPAARLGRVSGLAWASGYAGGLACLGLCLMLLINPDPPLFGLRAAAAEPVRAAALLAAAWIAVFSLPLLWLAPAPANRSSWHSALSQGLGGLGASLRAAAADRLLWRFLIARMLYTDGLNTLFAFGGIFAAGTFGMGAREVLLLGITLNISAGVGAAGFALAQDRLGDRTTILVAVGALAALGIPVLLTRSAVLFWILALGLGTFVGPAQSASRSLMARLTPEAKRNAQFGLYALSGRVTGFVGPAALGAVTAAFGSQRAGMVVVVLLLLAGWTLLATTPVDARWA
ncbi:MAG: MFS transporter [Rhodospirillales bacterium]|jgi:UMF1 family MFS transporter|nr:MFS transporter [Rhodospirillales bacterium]